MLRNSAWMASFVGLHVKCRNSVYPRSDGVQRTPVPDDLVDWSVNWNQYHPVRYTSPRLCGQAWADPDIETSTDVSLTFNHLDGKIDRRSFMGVYQLDPKGLPLNPCGRTGITGRGELGRWGPNHAADPIVTRWKRNSEGERILDPKTQRFILQFVAIERKDCGEWAIPGGMVDAGENCNQTLKREFAEEALSSLEATSEERENMKKMIAEFFAEGTEIYSGYVDDPRNTDNAWMETTAVNFHDEIGDRIAKFKLKAGDDAKKVCWMEMNSATNLYASHLRLLELVAKQRNASW